MTPATIATIGLHGSASTWVFNIVREMLAASLGDERLLAIYAEDPREMPDAAARHARHLLIKSHHGSEEFDAWLRQAQALMLLSLRDPRDAAISMSQRFNAPLEHTATWLERDCERMLRLADNGRMLLRYEERFFEDRALPDRLAAMLGLDLPPTVTAAIFARYATRAVRAFAQNLAALPAARLQRSGPIMLDRVTQIHRTHIGDARSGKWRRLPPSTRDALTARFQPFLTRFGYRDAPDAIIPVSPAAGP